VNCAARVDLLERTGEIGGELVECQLGSPSLGIVMVDLR
jgi:hypothetical protein